MIAIVLFVWAAVRYWRGSGSDSGSEGNTVPHTPMKTVVFSPKWKEELVCSLDDRQFVLELTMGKLTAFLPPNPNGRRPHHFALIGGRILLNDDALASRS